MKSVSEDALGLLLINAQHVNILNIRKYVFLNVHLTRYEFEKRRCVTESECHNMNTTLLRPGYNESSEHWFIWDTKCVSHCPRGLERDSVLGCKPCSGKCVLICNSSTVESIASAQTLKDCTYIKGSLEIQIRSGNQSFIYNELEENLGDIEEILGYLKITRSFPLMNLNFMKNLRIIHGSPDYISPTNHSLIILDNQNLQGLWDWDNRPTKKNFTIANGRIFFHYNPNLCLKHIYELASIAGLQNITNHEVAIESNGNKFACHAIDLQVTVVARFSTQVNLNISWPTTKGQKNNIMRHMFMVYYIKAPYQNLTADYETSECASYRWSVNDINQDKETRHWPLMNLEPDTQYAFFVKTYTVNSTGGQTPIQYFKTRPSKPTWPNDLFAVSNTSTSVTLFWKPPDKANGELNEYIITGFMREEEREMLKDVDFCSLAKKEQLSKKELEITTALPEFMTEVAKKNDDCCQQNKFEETFVTSKSSLFCQNLNQQEAKLPSMFLSSVNSKTCEMYVYDLIENSALKPPFAVRKRSIIENLNFEQNIDLYHTDLFQFPFRENVSGNTSTITFNNLEPYSLYSFQVQACRKIDPEIEKPNDPERCSMPSIVTVRTHYNDDGDIIPWLTAEVNNRSIEVKWQIPVLSNFMIMGYDIEYSRTDIANFRPSIDCISGSEYQNKGYYLLNGLPLGTYSIRVRAISLARLGPFTKSVTVVVSEISPAYIYLIVLAIISVVILIVLCIIFFFIYANRKYSSEPNLLLASVNPEYLGITQVDEEWELPRDNVQIIKELKRGNFGIVYEGLLLPEDKRVAVKKVLESSSDRDCVEFLTEACVMKQFTSAYHVVKLIGIVSKEWPQLVVMEMMDKGDLKSFLRESRHNPPTPNQMLLMAAQVADGMAFLEESKYVHRDLAARNCMVRKDLVVKIGDFGMTRDVYQTDYYRKGNKGLLPIRWMSPESLNDGVFTSKSDSWSYGVVLWEIATMAAQPYQGMSNEQVLTYVISGNKLELPPVIPKQFKLIINWCWRWKPKFRPSFLQILDELAEHTTKNFRDVSFYDSREGRIARAALASHPDQCLLEPSTSFAVYHPT
uniref:receptor protein-tyrosine kinase n=1 Tax=Oncopeltus fasciatus TaxID=7536 RepID=A0A2R4G8W5_ONCFA|nr:insulin receptor 2 [Oncopeltus fasciatus]